ncbi:MAG: GNAT family N-acetyltransferase [Armatimonadetes bacterium]|nr:GNAT family N-acetyltransferase [Armatimonadota bacterium]
MKIDYRIELPEKKQYFILFESTGWNEDYKMNADELVQTLRNSWFIYCAYFKNKLVGFGRILSDGFLHAVLFDVIVLPEFQREGIGKEIMKKLIDECKKNNIRDIQLFSARGKQEFYEKLGFEARPENAPGMEIRIKY